jgi:hypothetical protein
MRPSTGYLKKYQKHIKPVNKSIKTLIPDKLVFFPPKAVQIMYKDIKAAGEKIALIRERMTKTADYLAVLDHGKKDDAINGVISKQNEYYKNLRIKQRKTPKASLPIFSFPRAP